MEPQPPEANPLVLTEGACFKSVKRLPQPRLQARALRPTVALSADVSNVFRRCNPQFYYDWETRPKRYLTDPEVAVSNQQRDNEEKDLIVWMGKHIVDESTGTEYWIRSLLGCGTFGQVLRAINMTTKESCAIKIIKNDPSYYNQSKTEVMMLQRLSSQFKGEEDGVHVVKLHSKFDHANHLCLVFEQLRENLFEVLESNGYKGLSLNTVRPIIIQVLTTLKACAKAGIVHCDLKPENILMVKPPHHIKLIDFGSACEEHNTVYSYIQSRYYRAPEVLLGVEYTCMIDMWSLGCVAAEIFLGLPLLPGCNDYNQMYRIVEMIGFPPKNLLDEGTKTQDYFKRQVHGAHGLLQEDDDEEPSPPQPPPQAGKRVPPPPPKILPSHGYKLKSEAQYYRESTEEQKPFKRYFYYHKLADIVSLYSWPKEIRQCEDPAEKERLQAEEKKRRLVFIDFLHGLLHTDPRERWTAEVALKHPFVTGEAYQSAGTFHTEVALPEIEAKRNASMKTRSQPIYPGTTPSNNSLPVPNWGSMPIDMQRGMVSPGYTNGMGLSHTPASSFAQSPVPGMMFAGGSGDSFHTSPLPTMMGGMGMGQSSLGTSFPGASLGSSMQMGTPTQSMGAAPIPIPHNSGGGSEANYGSLPNSSFQTSSWMDSSGVAPSAFNNHSSPHQHILGTSPSQPIPAGGGGGGGGGGQRHTHRKGVHTNRAKRVDSTHGNNGNYPPGTSPSVGSAPPAYHSQPMTFSRTASHQHGSTPTHHQGMMHATYAMQQGQQQGQPMPMNQAVPHPQGIPIGQQQQNRPYGGNEWTESSWEDGN